MAHLAPLEGERNNPENAALEILGKLGPGFGEGVKKGVEDRLTDQVEVQLVQNLLESRGNLLHELGVGSGDPGEQVGLPLFQELLEAGGEVALEDGGNLNQHVPEGMGEYGRVGRLLEEGFELVEQLEVAGCPELPVRLDEDFRHGTQNIEFNAFEVDVETTLETRTAGGHFRLGDLGGHVLHLQNVLLHFQWILNSN